MNDWLRQKKHILMILFSLLLVSLTLARLPGFFCENNPQNWFIFWKISLPRIFIGFLIGGTLSLLGLIFQALFQNPMASPYTSGVSSAAAFGAGIILFSSNTLTSISWLNITTAALCSAIVALGMLLSLMRLRPLLDPSSLILCGLVCNYFFSSLLLLIQYFSDPSQLYALSHWLMGNLNLIGYSKVLVATVCAIFCLATFSRKSLSLDLACLSDDIAIARGLDINSFRRNLLLIGSLLVTILVANVGPIGFIGIIIPHITRIIFGHSHKDNLLPTFMLGAIFLSLCDLVAVSLLSQTELPVGLITSIIGGPIFIILLINTKSYKFS